MINEIEIKDDVYHLLKESNLLTGTGSIKRVNGKLSKTLRPDGSSKEDVIISVLTPNPNSQVQELYLNVNVYVADVKRGNQYEENTIRLRELMTLSDEAFKSARGKRFRLTLAEQKAYPVPGKNEHFINNKVLYQFCNE